MLSDLSTFSLGYAGQLMDKTLSYSGLFLNRRTLASEVSCWSVSGGVIGQLKISLEYLPV